VIFGAKILYKKRSRKTLMKLTPGWFGWFNQGNFRSQFHQYFLHAFFVQKPFSNYVLALSELSYEKRSRKTLMKLNTGGPSNSR